MKITSYIAGSLFLAFMAASCNNSKTEDTVSETQQVEQTESGHSAASANSLPGFRIFDVNGQELQMQNLKGKKVFVNLWASWCPPCKREMPSIEKLYKDVKSDSVQFIMLALDDQFEKSKNYVAGAKLDLPIYYPAENLPALFNVQGIPATFIFNENGELIKRVDGMDDYDTKAYRDLLGK